MDLDSLRCFLAAASQPSFRRAARAVHLSPAAFSDRIARLEAALEVRLFDRSTRHVAITPAGERLLPAARRLVGEINDLPALVRDDGRPPPVTLTLGTRYELGLSWVLPTLDALQDAHPERTIHLRFSDSHALLEALQGGTVDAVVTSFRLTLPGLDYATLHPERYVFVGAPALLAERPLTGPGDSLNHVLIDAHGDLPLFRYLLDAWTSPEAWSFAETRLVGTIAGMRLLTLKGRGVAVLPRYFVQADLDAGRLVALVAEVEPVQDWFRLVWRQGDPRAPALQALAAELRSVPLR